MFGVCAAQPQYRVSVDPPFLVSGLPVNVTADSVSVILCFREAGSMNGADLNYCPLGMITRTVNSVNEPLQELRLREGAENLPPACPTAVGLYVTVLVRNSNTTLGAHQFHRINTTCGTLCEVGPTLTTIGHMLVTVFFRVDCVLGSDCTVSTDDLQITDGELVIFTPYMHTLISIG